MVRNTLLLLLLSAIYSCNSEMSQQLEPKGVALGKMNEIVVIADDELWESAVGDTFRYYFGSAYPILPQPEPLFDLRQFTVDELREQPLRKELRSYVILSNLSDENSATTQMVKRDMGSEKYNQALTTGSPSSSVGKDKWSRGQILVYLFGPDRDALIETIKKSFPATTRRINQHDEKQLKASVYVDRINLGISESIKEEYGLDIKIPGDYAIAVNDTLEDVIWLRKDLQEAILNIVIRKIPYKSPEQFEKQNLIKLRNEFGKSYVSSDIKDDYMVVNEEDLPVYDYIIEIDGNYTKEIRGTWEMTVDFAAGPFNTYLIHNKGDNELIYIDVFVLAPGKDKRDYMMQLDYIVNSAKLTDSSPESQ